MSSLTLHIPDFARTIPHRLSDGLSVVRVLRFDRQQTRRLMAISGASLLQTEYPGSTPADAAHWSYPRLAEELRRIGAPDEDRKELFGRMVFNAVLGNDDDHPRNHAAIFDLAEQRWRLSPAFDVVPNPDETPKRLTLQLSRGSHAIARDAILADAIRFGFETGNDAARHLEALLARIQSAFQEVSPLLPQDLRNLLLKRMTAQLKLLA